MKIRMRDGLPFVTASITYRGHELTLENVLLDTGSAGCIFATEKVLTIGLEYRPEDVLHRIHGVGGAEFVFTKIVERLSLGELHADTFEIEIGGMDYGFNIEGIVGMDFLFQVGAVVDLARLDVHGVSSA